MKAAPWSQANVGVRANPRSIGRSQSSSSRQSDPTSTPMACFLSGDTPLLCENPWKPGSLVMRTAANASLMHVLVLDNVSGEPTFAKVHRVCALQENMQLQWSEVAFCTSNNCTKTTIILANSVLTHCPRASQWRDPPQLNMLTDKLCGLEIPR